MILKMILRTFWVNRGQLIPLIDSHPPKINLRCNSILVRSNGEVLITFLTPEAANHVMANGPHLEAGTEKLFLSWWLPRDQPRTKVKTEDKLLRSEEDLTRLLSSPPPTAIIGPLERMHDLCLRQNWGIPQYNCSTFLDKTGQHVYQYEVSVPAVSKICLLGEPSHDRHMALINSACAALQVLNHLIR